MTSADQKMTQMAARNCSHSWWADPVYIRPLTAERHAAAREPSGRSPASSRSTWPLASRWPQPYSIMFGSPKMPSSMPPMKPAMPWV